jgi:hypothetical protein
MLLLASLLLAIKSLTSSRVGRRQTQSESESVRVIPARLCEPARSEPPDALNPSGTGTATGVEPTIDRRLVPRN